MNTSGEAIQRLQQALESTRSAVSVIDDLIVEHDYQDVASLIAQAAAALLETAALLMQSQDEPAFDALEKAEDFLDLFYGIVEGETDED